jgi:hypothetical protein
VKRRDTSGERSESGQGLRAQLTRAVGGSFDALRSKLTPAPKTVGVSKQRLSDVLWNDRTMLATHETAKTRAAAGGAVDALESIPDSEFIEVSADELTPVDDFALQRALNEVRESQEQRESSELRESGEPRKRVDTRPSEVVRARLEHAKARVARLTSMPKGVAPLAGESPAWLTSEDTQSKDDMLADLTPPSLEVEAPHAVAGPPPLPSAVVAPPPPPVPARVEPPPLPRAPARVEPPPPVAAALAPADDDGDEEPIRTRSMARLLAGQGHRKRALKIYDALLAIDGSDESLRAEADALRRAG